MTDLKMLQEASKLIDTYPDVIDVIRNSPNESQAKVCKKMRAKYTDIWVIKVVKQLKNVGLINEFISPKGRDMNYEVNEGLISLVIQFARQYSQQIQK